MHPWGGSDATLRPEASGWVLLAMIPSSCPAKLKAPDATVLITAAGQMAARMGLTASGRPAMMQCA